MMDLDHFFADCTSSVVRSNRILYTPSTFARSSLLYLQEIGELQAFRPHVSSRSGLHSYLFFMVVSGAGSLMYDGKEYKLIEGDCVFIDCLRSYSHSTGPDNLWKLRWIHFSSSLMGQVYEKYCERGGAPAFHLNDSSQFFAVWHKIMEITGLDDYIRDMRINAALGELLVLMMENSWHPEKMIDLPKKRGLVISVKQYLDQNYDQRITLDDLSNAFYINKYYLAKCFKAYYGQSIHTCLLSIRITHAKRLLRFSDKSIEEIGQLCGFGAAHYFSAKFKEVEGVPPSDYRERW